MDEKEPPIASVVPFTGWHLIQEVDLARLVARHERLAQLCDRLEACADALPEWPSASETARLCRELEMHVEQEMRYDGSFLAEMFATESRNRLTAALLRQVDTRQVADVIHGQDLIAVLRREPPMDRFTVDAMAYMLRCFFMAVRQALAFEELAVLQLGQHRLTAEGRTMLVESLCRRVA